MESLGTGAQGGGMFFLPFYPFTFLLLNLLFSKQAEELSIYQVSNLSEVFRILSKLQTSVLWASESMLTPSIC